MDDHGKVLKGLEYHLKELSVGKTCFECPYCGNNPCEIQLITDALVLLKAQEPIPCGEKIKAGDVMLDFYECGHCKNAIRKPWRYCPFCGKEVKWNG